MIRLRSLLGALLVGALGVPAAVAAAEGDPRAPGASVGSTGSADSASTQRERTESARVGSSRVDTASVPVASPERIAAPMSVAVVGDSISQGTGANGRGAPGGGIGSPRPAASWATGTRQGLDSYAQRLGALHGEITTHDLSANGASIRNDLVEQVEQVPDGTDLVLVQMGGNDLCRPSVDEMTPLDVARDEIRTALAWLHEHRPETVVYVSSIPDIYSLWYVRGASHRGEQYPFVGFVVSGRDGPRAPRSFAENNNKRTARLLWETLAVIPCRSLLAEPNSPRNAGPTPDPTHPAEQRRLAVRAHTIALNEVWEQECDAVLRCVFDDGAVFDVVSNRDADGLLLADKADWTFVDADISTQDHFHPSFSGQRKLAETAWSAGPDWTDTSPPVGYPAVLPAPGVDGPSAEGWYTGAVTVEVLFRDEAGVRGIEHRVHREGDAHDGDADGEPRDLPWSTTIGDVVRVAVVDEGQTWVEVRALDVNGNQSASLLVPVRIDRRAPTAVITSPSPGEELVLGAPVVARHECDDEGSGLVSCEASARAGVYVDASKVGTHEVRVDAVDAAGHRTTTIHEYHVRYAWSGTTGPLERGLPREFVLGQPVPVQFVLADARGRAVPDAGYEISLVGPGGRERSAPARLGGDAGTWHAWASAHGAQFFLLDTRTLRAGVWEVVVRPDDGSEHRVNFVLHEPHVTVGR